MAVLVRLGKSIHWSTAHQPLHCAWWGLGLDMSQAVILDGRPYRVTFFYLQVTNTWLLYRNFKKNQKHFQSAAWRSGIYPTYTYLVSMTRHLSWHLFWNLILGLLSGTICGLKVFNSQGLLAPAKLSRTHDSIFALPCITLLVSLVHL